MNQRQKKYVYIIYYRMLSAFFTNVDCKTLKSKDV